MESVRCNSVGVVVDSKSVAELPDTVCEQRERASDVEQRQVEQPRREAASKLGCLAAVLGGLQDALHTVQHVPDVLQPPAKTNTIALLYSTCQRYETKNYFQGLIKNARFTLANHRHQHPRLFQTVVHIEQQKLKNILRCTD